MDADALASVALGLAPMLERSGESPLALAGRVAGLGAQEMASGIPKWAWLGIGLTAGVTVMWVWGDDLKRLTSRKRSL